MKKIILLILVCLSFSCKHKPAEDFIDNENGQDTTYVEDTTTVNVESENSEDFSIKFKSIGFIQQFEEKFLRDFMANNKTMNWYAGTIDDQMKGVIERYKYDSFFYANLVIQNNTPNKMTSVKLSGIIKAVYADGKMEYWPSGVLSNSPTEKNILEDDLVDIFGFVSKYDEMWNSNEIREYYLMDQFEDYKIPGVAFMKNETINVFKRTPLSLILVINYKAISVDKEYTKTISYDILDSWKECQTELGLR